MTTAKTKSKTMSQAHKDALEQGRNQGRAVKAYLDALAIARPRRGRKRTPETVEKQLDLVVGMINDNPNSLTKLQLVQERMDLEEKLASFDQAEAALADLVELEAAFVTVALGYSERKGISTATWRQVGVPAAVLTRAGL